MKSKIDLFGIRIDAITRDEAVSVIVDVIKNDSHDAHMVVTPNVDHIVKLHKNREFRVAYAKAFLTIVDGNPVLWASKLLNKPVPETVPGSDLSVMLLEQAKKGSGFSMFLLGAPPGVADKAKSVIEEDYENIRVVGTSCPPFGFENDQDELNRIIQQINDVEPDLLLVGLGAPKQEIWAHSHKFKLKTKVILCAGATIEFIAQEKKRAPLWVQKIAMEWAYRMMLEPKRLMLRYIHDAVVFPYLVVRECFK